MKVSDRAYGNKIGIRMYIAISLALLILCILNYFMGMSSLLYLIIFSALCIAPVILDLLVYVKEPESRAICFITGTGYGLMYCYAVFASDSALTFTYAFPMFVVVTLFSDMLYCMIFGGLAVLINIVYIVYHFATAGYGVGDIPDLEIRILCTVFTAVYVVVTTMAINRMNSNKIKQIDEQNKKAEEAMKLLIETSDSMISGIAEANDKVAVLGESVSRIASAMGEVSTGSTDTAESIQEQMQQTEEIQNHIVQVKNTTGNIEERMQNTARKVEDGNVRMEALADQVVKSMEANNHVLAQMKELTEYTRQMNTIIETISNIADSTVMLSLNASIEAARAGEAGRGFAVVAGEISALANQTMTATVNITELINNINGELKDVEAAVDVVTESNKANADSTKVVREHFAGILKGTEEVEDQTRELLLIVSSLEEANASIVEKIQSISAITEEVSAHANETYEACEENSRIVEETTHIVQNLNIDAEKLKNI